MWKIISFAFMVLFFTFLKAQIPVNGWVWDARNGERLKGAIVADKATGQATLTNENGYYSLNLNSGKHILSYSAEGYAVFEDTFDIYNITKLNIKLNTTFSNTSQNQNAKYISKYDYRSAVTLGTQTNIENYKELGCAPDLNKFLQFLPGVQQGRDGLADLFIRGGNTDQNMLTMDGLPIYGSGRIFGLLGSYNTGLIRGFELYRGIAPARYGGRAGGVLDVRYKDGTNKGFNAEFQINPLNFTLNAETKLDAKGKTLLSLGIRRSWIDLLLQGSGGNSLDVNFHDLNFKITHRAKDQSQWSIWAYNGRDKYAIGIDSLYVDSIGNDIEDKSKSSLIYQNTLIGGNYVKQINNTTFMQLTAGMSRFKFLNELERELNTKGFTNTENSARARYYNSITDFILKSEFQKSITSVSTLRFGTEHVLHALSPGTFNVRRKSTGKPTQNTTEGKVNNVNAIENAAFAELEIHLFKKSVANIGARLWTFNAYNKTWIRVEPRILISIPSDENGGFKLSFGSTNQGLHQTTSVNGTFPSDAWVASSLNFKPQQSWQAGAGYYTSLNNGWLLTADLYYRWLNGLNEQTGLQSSAISENFWLKTIEQGTGKSRGIELSVTKKYGNLTSINGISLSKSDRTMEFINQGRTFPFRWDRRFKMAGQLVYQLTPRTKINFAIVFMTGNAVSTPTAVYLDAFGNKVFDYPERNNTRLKNYFRIDFGFERKIGALNYDMDRANQFWGIHIYNLTANKNQSNLSEIRQVQVNNQFNRSAVFSAISFAPSAYYKLQF